jgi:SAM-dependent methyltransferase
VTGLEFNEEVAAQLDVAYRKRDVLRRRKLVRDALAAKSGERILDVGCGPGFYLAELLDEVGPDGSAVGVDASAPMLAVAAERCKGFDNVAFHEANATSLPVADGEFDAALSVQVMEYVAEIDAALAEIHRALRPGGRVVIWDVDWATLSMHSADPQRMQRALAAWEGHLADPSLPRTLTARLREAGFEEIEMESHAFATNEDDSESYADLLLPMIEEFIAGVDDFGPEQAKAWMAEQRELRAKGESYFSIVQARFSATKR